MSSDLAFGALAFSSLLAIVNPLSAATLFLALTAEESAPRRRGAVLRAFLTATTVLVVFAAAGPMILDFFGITTYAFKIAGGILFFGVGSDMLQAKRSRVKTTREEEADGAVRVEEGNDVGIVPLGLPTLAGPGAITTVIALVAQADGNVQAALVYIAIVCVLLVASAALLVAPALRRTFGQTGMNVMTRIMGLLVMVIGVQFVLDGSREAFRTMR